MAGTDIYEVATKGETVATIEIQRNGEEIKKISRLTSLVKKERNKPDNPLGSVWMRGVSWKHRSLRPSIGREHYFAGTKKVLTEDIERDLLHRFRRFAYEYIGRPITDWEALFVARHHGLPVRLLDWTSNPLAALYFACEFHTDADDDACIWLLTPGGDANHRLDAFEGESNPFDVEGVRLLYPMVIAPRINAQCGYFTIQKDPWTSLEEMGTTDFGEGNLDIVRLTEHKIRREYRKEILRDLNELEVTRRTLFPDLDGIAKGLLNAEILRRDQNG